jgi:aldose 1-epimerase
MPDELLRMAGGPFEVELLPGVGGRLHRLRAFGHDVLRTPDTLEVHRREPVAWGAYTMAPWCNRLSTAPTPVGDRVVRLPASFADGSALHGQVAAIPWTLADDESLVVRGGGDGWPWPYEVTQRLTIRDACLRIDLSLTNLADGPMPAGLGIHPWFRRPLAVRLAGSRVVPSNLDPAAGLEPVAGDLDLRRLRSVPDGLDGTWTDLDEPALEVRWPELGLTAEISLLADAGRCVALATLPGIDAVAIEPQTHLPQGLRRLLEGDPGGLHFLAPGATLQLTTEWRFSRATR